MEAEAHHRILNRLRRANGQLTAVVAAVENGSPCRDVVTQLAAVTSALHRAGFAIVSTAMRDCLAEPQSAAEPAADALTAEELEKLFLMLA